MLVIRRTIHILTLPAIVVSSCSSGDKLDPNFSAAVEKPAYPSEGPRVLFDEAHHNMHTATGSYRPFAELIKNDGYRVARGRSRIAPATLEECQVFVIANAQGTNERNDDPAFDDAECDAIEAWVSRGGALLLITDHYPMGHAVEGLARRFGMEMSKGVVEDSVHWDPAFEPTHIVFTRVNGGLQDHPILEGRDPAERIQRILTFTGQALEASPPAASFLKLSSTAVARPPEPQVERRGGDVIVKVRYGEPAPASGMAQGIALDFGDGRVVVLGEAAMLTARLRRYDEIPIGMNVQGYDNRQLALNIMHWLSRRL